MVKRFAALAAATIMGAVIAGWGVSVAGPRIASPYEIQTIEANKVQHTVDLGKRGLTPGDTLTIRDDLTALVGGATLGQMHEVCTVIPSKKLSFECLGTAEFADGQISVAGEFPPSDPDNSYAITGGTGTYENVGGKMEIASAGHGVLALNFFVVP